MTNPDLYQRLTDRFAAKHGLGAADIESQWLVVEEEIEEMLREYDDLKRNHIPEIAYTDPKPEGWERAADTEVMEPLAMEMADVVFTLHLAARMLGIDLRTAFERKARYNLEKTGEVDANGKIVDDAGSDPAEENHGD